MKCNFSRADFLPHTNTCMQNYTGSFPQKQGRNPLQQYTIRELHLEGLEYGIFNIQGLF